MPRSGKAVKRRHSIKVSRKPKRLPKPTKLLTAKYDHRLTLTQNMAKQGIVHRPNPADKNHVMKVDTEMDVDVPPEAVRQRSLSEGKQKWCKDAILKYSCNYRKMARDEKLNKNQMTDKQIKKMCQTYLKIYGDPTARVSKEDAKESDR